MQLVENVPCVAQNNKLKCNCYRFNLLNALIGSTNVENAKKKFGKKIECNLMPLKIALAHLLCFIYCEIALAEK